MTHKAHHIDVKYDKDSLKPYLDTNIFPNLNFFTFENVKHMYGTFYIVNHRNKEYVLVVHNLSDENVIVKQALDSLGQSLHIVQETNTNDRISARKSGNITTYFNHNNDIINVERDIEFKSININFKKKDRINVNENIGTIDLETYNVDNMSKCYAIGFYTGIDNVCKTYYIDKDLNSYKIIQDCINELLRSKYHNHTFYCHNFGKLDAPFIIKALIEFNK